ncbi:MAG: hypothetical protein ABJE00_07550, partial [Erythrobacter sp.]
RIFMEDNPVHENGMPAHGNAFVSQGYIYPAGTLEADTKGVLEDGSPAFPDLVLGTWTCDGYFVGEGANATTGVWVISRQVFAFEDGKTIITQGTEIVDAGVENLRSITGATGEYAEMSGGMIQTLLGFSEQMTVNVSFRMETQTSDHNYLTPEDANYDHGDARQDDHLEWDSGFPVGPILDESDVPSV